MSDQSRTDEDKNAAADASAALLNSGLLRVYAGTIPADVNAGLGGATLLSEHDYSATAFAPAVAGVATSNAITDVSAVGTGTATFYRAFKTGGTVATRQGDVSTTAAGTGDLQFDNTSITTGQTVNIGTHTITEV
ncbi:hypothetical protein CL622_04500 [archaeon]|nr:hypothetical protein [archaeon]|tara:strand:- start:555 stop:959 length:405 start_codon:yes stop_codon:yes gene_type:complete